MGDQWHYIRAGKQSGPVSAADLQQLAASGRLSPTDSVWRDGMATWAPASSVKGLFNSAADAAPGADFPNEQAQNSQAVSISRLGLFGGLIGGGLAILGGLIALYAGLGPYETNISDGFTKLMKTFFLGAGAYFVGKGIAISGNALAAFGRK